MKGWLTPDEARARSKAALDALNSLPSPTFTRGGVLPEPREDVAVAEVLAVEICAASGRHTAGDGDHDAERWGACCQCRHYARVVAPLIAERVMDEHERGFEAGYEQARGDFAERERAAAVEALRLVREVEREMSIQAFDAWRAADARRGLADHDALLVHADALTRWSERLRMAFDGQDYRADRRAER